MRKATVAKLKPAPGKQLAVPQQVLTFDQQLLRIAGDPSIPVSRLEALANLRSKIRAEDAEEEFNVALVAAQKEMKPIMADRENTSTHSKYATLYAVDKKLRPIYSKYGFSLSFSTADCPFEGHQRILCYVSRGLHTRTYQYDVAIDPKGPKGNDVMTKTHAGGSALSYGKRYLELMIFNVTVGKSEDDDANLAAGIDKMTDKQVKALTDLAKTAGADTKRFCDVMGVKTIAEIPASKYEEAVSQLNRKLKKKQEDAAKKKKDDSFPGDRPL